jgi:hypothetical protein
MPLTCRQADLHDIQRMGHGCCDHRRLPGLSRVWRPYDGCEGHGLPLRDGGPDLLLVELAAAILRAFDQWPLPMTGRSRACPFAEICVKSVACYIFELSLSACGSSTGLGLFFSPRRPILANPSI